MSQQRPIDEAIRGRARLAGAHCNCSEVHVAPPARHDDEHGVRQQTGSSRPTLCLHARKTKDGWRVVDDRKWINNEGEEVPGYL